MKYGYENGDSKTIYNKTAKIHIPTIATLKYTAIDAFKYNSSHLIKTYK